MATHARQQYFADESSLSKEKREFSIAEEVQQKIDGIEEGAQVNKIETIKVNGSEVQPDENKAVDLTIPGVVDSLDSTSSTDALSARQGKVLYDYIQDVSHIGHFLALWDASTGLPVTDPETSPYIYNTGDFYTVSVVAPQGGTNYKPDGTQYVIGQASTAVDTDDVAVNDFYFYDGTTWRHMKNSGAGSIAIDGSLSTTSTNPVENRVITNALSGKQNTLTAGANIQINGNTISATDTKYTAGTNVQISNQNVISATDTKYTAGTGINIDANNVISNTQTSAEWGNITGTLSDQADLQTALNAKQDNMVILKYGISTWNDFITAYNKNGVIYCRASSNSNPASGSQTRLAFMAYVNNETAPTEVEFQYYRSRSSHSTAATVLDEVYVYKLVSTGGGTWSVTQRDTAAKPLAGTGIGFTYNASGMTISADTSVLATKTDLNSKQDTLVSGTNIKTINNNSLLGSGDIALNDVKVSATAPSSPTEGMVWYDTDLYNLQVYNGSTHQWDTLNNIFHMVTPGVGDDMADYINILEDSGSRLLIFSFNANMSDLWIVTDYERENWDEQTQKYENFKITAIGKVSDNADTTFIQNWGLTRPKGIATLEIIGTHQLDTYVCSTVQFKESGGFELAPNSPLNPKYRRYGTQAQYDALTQYYTDEPGDTVYFTI